MTRTFFRGAWYSEALASGAYAVLFPNSHIETHAGRVELPLNDQPLYHRITEVGGFKMAGQAHRSTRTLEWIGGQWLDRPAACGVSPVIYDHAGVLVISNCGPVGSQGFRYVTSSNQIMSGDDTYGSTFGLSEWSRHDGLFIGQGHAAGGALVYDGAALRVLELGDCRFIRVRGDGDRVAVSFVKPDGAVIVQTTLAELRALPTVGTTAPTPGIPPAPPIPTPSEPPTMPVLELPADVYAIVVALYERNRTLAAGSDEDRRALQQKICETVRARKGARWGWKSNHGIGLANAKDAIAQLPEGAVVRRNERQPLYIWDVFNGSTREPNRAPIHGEMSSQFFVPVEPIDHLAAVTPVPVPGPTPRPPAPAPSPDALAAILRRLDALEGPRKVAIKAHTGTYLTAEGGGGGEVNATRPNWGPWETFTIEAVK